jgi:hypothetical protein
MLNYTESLYSYHKELLFGECVMVEVHGGTGGRETEKARGRAREGEGK